MPDSIHSKPKRQSAEALSAQRKEEILAQAALLFARHGYSETDTQLLAETIGVGKGTVYRYFSSKRELFLAAADRVMRRLHERINERIATIDDPQERIAAGVKTFLAFFAEHPEFVELLMQERALFKDLTRPTFMEHRAMNIEKWRNIYRTLIGAGRVRDMPVERITETVGNLLYGTIFMNYFSGQTSSTDAQAQDKMADAQARNIIDIVFHGILTEKGKACTPAESPPANV